MTILDCGCEVRVKRDKSTCSRCGDTACPKHIYFYVDGNNSAITKNAAALCFKCAYPDKSKQIEKLIVETAHFCCDNPNGLDIEDALRELVQKAIRVMEKRKE